MERIRRLLEPPRTSFFLFGPRGTGKSHWLGERFAGAHGSGGGVEVDFVLRQGKRLVAIEAKAGRRFKPAMVKGLKAIADLPGVKRRVLVYGGADSWTTDDGIEVLAADRFAAQVAQGF